MPLTSDNFVGEVQSVYAGFATCQVRFMFATHTSKRLLTLTYWYFYRVLLANVLFIFYNVIYCCGILYRCYWRVNPEYLRKQWLSRLYMWNFKFCLSQKETTIIKTKFVYNFTQAIASTNDRHFQRLKMLLVVNRVFGLLPRVQPKQ